MHFFWHKVVAIVLLAGVIISTIPAVSLHHHEDTSCTEHDTASDLCHLQIYHGYFSAEYSCEHNTHVHEEIKKCEWCKFVKPLRDNDATYEQVTFFQSSVNTTLNSEYSFYYKAEYILSNQGRAPPIS